MDPSALEEGVGSLPRCSVRVLLPSGGTGETCTGRNGIQYPGTSDPSRYCKGPADGGGTTGRLMFHADVRSTRTWNRSRYEYLLIAVGGALGSIARYWVGSTISGRIGAKFPYGTFVINITACVIIGFTLTYLSKRADLNPAWRYLFPVGFIGAYSTFSTYEWETLSTLRSGAFALGALYALGSLVLGLAAVWAGTALADLI